MHSDLGIFFAVTLTLFFVIDALGNVPTYLQLVKLIEKKERFWITVPRLVFALILMLAFHFLGTLLLALLEINMATVQISGGIMLFLIAIRLIFSNDGEKAVWGREKPFFVPIATPIFAGPCPCRYYGVCPKREFSGDPHRRNCIRLVFIESHFLGGNPHF